MKLPLLFKIGCRFNVCKWIVVSEQITIFHMKETERDQKVQILLVAVENWTLGVAEISSWRICSNNNKSLGQFKSVKTQMNRIAYFVLVIIYFTSEVYSLNNGKDDHMITTEIFIGCFIMMLILIVVFHCWLKRRPLYKEDWNTMYVYHWKDDGSLKSNQTDLLIKHKQMMRNLWPDLKTLLCICLLRWYMKCTLFL